MEENYELLAKVLTELQRLISPKRKNPEKKEKNAGEGPVVFDAKEDQAEKYANLFSRISSTSRLESKRDNM